MSHYIWSRLIKFGGAQSVVADVDISYDYIDGLMQERRNSCVLAMDLRLSCITPSKSKVTPGDIQNVPKLSRMLQFRLCYFKHSWNLTCIYPDMSCFVCLFSIVTGMLQSRCTGFRIFATSVNQHYVKQQCIWGRRILRLFWRPNGVFWYVRRYLLGFRCKFRVDEI